jgi:hypothetical protein
MFSLRFHFCVLAAASGFHFCVLAAASGFHPEFVALGE